MTPARFEEIRELFDAVCNLSPEDRQQRLAQRCEHDPDLRRQVERLLRRSERRDEPIDTPAIGGDLMFAAVADVAMHPPVPLSVGPFRIVRLIGQGGMGSVYEAQQEKPNRRVAVKIIRADALSPEAMRRFEHEAQILGRLQHPGIACIYEAGVAPTMAGPRPYFAMELVRGSGLSQYIQSHALDVRTRLELLVRICEAVDHAHLAGIVHRDLKPSNILIDAAGQPKIVDFGVARATSGGEVAVTMHTLAGQVIGTLAYMSPEQVGGRSAVVDARSDVYSLGVIMFELLTGRLPHNLRDCSLPEAARILREDDPTRLSAVDAGLRGDLDTIVAKALDKDPARRYSAAGALAEDLRRFLRDDPVLARPASTLYQVRKFARRHRELVAGVVAAFVILLAGLAGVSLLAVRESRQRALAQQNETRATWESYRNCIIAADRSLQLRDAGKAVQLLDSAPADLRGWEWSYLKGLSDQSLLKIQARASPVRGVMVAGGGEVIVSASADGWIERWSARNGAPISSVQAHAEGIAGFAASPDGRRFISSGAGHEVVMWDAASGSELWRITASGPIHAQAFFPDGAKVAVPMNSRIGFFDAASGREVGSLALPLADGQSAAIGTDGSLLMCHIGTLVAVFEIASGRELRRFEASGFSFSRRDGHAWLYFEFHHRLDEVDARTGAKLLFIDDVRDSTVAVGSTWLATIREAGHMSLCDAATGERHETLLGHTAPVTSSALCPDETRLVTADAGGEVRLWSTSAAGPVLAIPASNDALISADVSPDGKRAITGGWGSVKLWDLSNGQELVTAFPLGRDIHAVRFDRSGRRVAIGGYDGAVVILSADDASVICRTVRVANGISVLAWSPDGRHIIAATVDGTLYRFSSEDGTQISQRKVSGRALGAMEVSPDGQICAVSAEDGRTWLYGLQDRDSSTSPPREITGQLSGAGLPSPVHAMTFDESGGLLAAGMADGSVTILDTRTHRNVRTIRGGGIADIRAIAFTPDGSRMFIGCADSTIHVLDVASGDDLLQLHDARTSICRLRASEAGLVAVAVHAPGACYVYGRAPSATEVLAREHQHRVRGIVDRLFASEGFSADVIAALQADSAMSQEDRQAAIRLAGARGDHPNFLNEQAWTVARFPHATADAYRLAVRKAELACRIRPDQHSYLNTLGVAQFRAGAFEEAATSLTRCTEMLRETAGRPHPLDVLVLAMTHQRLGEGEKAAAGLRRARELMTDEQYREDAECLWFLAEAQEMIAPASDAAAKVPAAAAGP